MSWLRDEKSARFWSLELTGNRYSRGLPELDTNGVVADAVRAGANVLVCFGLGHRCHAYFPSRYFPHHPQLGGREPFLFHNKI